MPILRKLRNHRKEQLGDIQDQIDKMRNSVEDKQSRIAWQTVNEVKERTHRKQN